MDSDLVVRNDWHHDGVFMGLGWDARLNAGNETMVESAQTCVEITPRLSASSMSD